MKFLFFLPSIKPDTCETYLHEKLIDKFIRINSFEWRYHSTPKNTFPGHHFTYSSHVLWSEAGFEPAILGLVIKCSTTVLLTLIFLLHCHFYHWIWNNLRWKETKVTKLQELHLNVANPSMLGNGGICLSMSYSVLNEIKRNEWWPNNEYFRLVNY